MQTAFLKAGLRLRPDRGARAEEEFRRVRECQERPRPTGIVEATGGVERPAHFLDANQVFDLVRHSSVPRLRRKLGQRRQESSAIVLERNLSPPVAVLCPIVRFRDATVTAFVSYAQPPGGRRSCWARLGYCKVM